MWSQGVALLRPLGPEDAVPRGDVEVPASGVSRIGRGPLLGVTDKRVSREHGLLELVKGKLRVKPLHVNPCYHGPRGSAPLRPLPRGEWTWLQPGDRLALLADAFVYEVVYLPGDSCPEESAPADDDWRHAKEPPVCEEAPPKETQGERPMGSPGSEPCTSQRGQRSTGAAVVSSDHAGPKNENGTSCAPDTSKKLPHRPVDASIGGHLNVEKERKLPAWMLADDDVQEDESPSKAKGGKGKGRARPQARACGAGKRRPPDSDEDGVESGNQKKIKLSTTKDREQEEVKEENMNEEPGSCGNPNELPNESLNESLSESLNASPSELAAESDLAGTSFAGDPWEKEEAVPPEQEDQRDVPHTSSGQSVSSQHLLQKEQQPVAAAASQRRPSRRESGGDDGETAAQKMQRPPCAYADRCYRKNPLHFKECSHPGDADYVLDEVSDADKPDCPYGTSCYRQNPQHKRAFSHTNPPVAGLGRPQRKTTQRVIADDSGDESEDSELENSFIDDDSELEEGSEWEPEFSDGEEDLKTLTKEAKQFTRKKNA